MSQKTQQLNFKSKIPRPVIPNKISNAIVSDSKVLNKQPDCKLFGSHSSKKFAKHGGQAKEKVDSQKYMLEPRNAVPERGFKCDNEKSIDVIKKVETDKAAVEEEEEFQTDEKALECILSNKGITPGSLSRPSTIQRSSMYYQPPSRLSLMDSQVLFKEKMKVLNDKMKSFNIKGKETPKSEKEKTLIVTSTFRPVNIYFKTKSLETNHFSTPRTIRHLQNNVMSLSEAKTRYSKDVKDERLCSTASKMNSKWEKTSSTSAVGKENKTCRFKLFANPINESPENDSSAVEQTSHCVVTMASLTPHRSMLQQYPKHAELKDSSCDSTVTCLKSSIRTCSTNELQASLSKPILSTAQCGPSNSFSFAPLSLSSPSKNTCAVVSTPTLCTWSLKNTMCTPTFDSVSRKLTTDKLVLKHDPDKLEVKESVVKANTPVRIVVKTKKLHGGPQRTPISFKSMQTMHQSSFKSTPLLFSHLRTTEK